MSIIGMDKLFRPDSIAVIGASGKENTIAELVLSNLKSGGFSGNVWHVNPKRSKKSSRNVRPSVADIEEPVDLAIAAMPMPLLPGIIPACAAKGVGGLLALSGSGRETGEYCRKVEAKIKKEIAETGIRMIGPNCFGIISAKQHMNASVASRMPFAGKPALISQSGTVLASILDLSGKEHIGFSYVVGLGAMLDVEFGDLIDYLGGKPDVSSIVMYMERLTRYRHFMSAAREVSRVKPLIVLKAGRTAAGSKAASWHTGALTSEDAVYDAAFKRAGIVRVKTFEELFDCTQLLSRQRKLKGAGLMIITNSGGAGVMAADALNDYGIEPVPLSDETIAELGPVLPQSWSRSNPIDILGDATPERYCRCVEICMRSSDADGLLIMLSPLAITRPLEVAKALIALLDKKTLPPVPVFMAWLGGLDTGKGREVINRAGIPTFDTPERAVRAFADLHRYAENIEILQQIPSRLHQKLHFNNAAASHIIQYNLDRKQYTLDVSQTNNILAAYGFPVSPVLPAADEKQAVAIANEIGFPVAMKVDSDGILHKSHVGGTELNLKNNFEVIRAYHTILANVRQHAPEAGVDGVWLQAMVEHPDFELILGAKKDPHFGPVILFGQGGTMTEILHDCAIGLPPLNRLLARRIIEQTKMYHILKGFHQRPPVDMELIEELLIRLSQLVSDFPQIAALDINPLIIKDDTPYIVDAGCCIQPADNLAPHHLAISPYPDRYEDYAQAKTGEPFFIRPIRPEDADLLIELFGTLSSRTIYYRFFSPLKQLSQQMLVRFTQIDYDRSMALVAILESGGREEMIGVARVITVNDPVKMEFAVLIQDSWQGKGVGAELLKRCLDIAHERHVEEVFGTVLAENTQMISLGKKLGFKIRRVPDSGEYELHLNTSPRGENGIRRYAN